MLSTKLRSVARVFLFGIAITALLTINSGGIIMAGAVANDAAPQAATVDDAIVFVSRQIPSHGSVYYTQAGSMPGVQPYSRFQVAAPGKLIIREANGTLRTLVNGSNPTGASLNLIDVNAPDVSYDGTKIVFTGLPSGTYSLAAVGSPGAWRIYIINVDGTGLRQVTFSDRNISLSQFGSVASNFTRYDDTDPAWLPDGRIVFSSTRWPSFGQYGAALTSNLYVINESGTGLHRITAERNGAERPIVDPLTGRIVFARWWRNFRLGTNNMATIPYSEGGYIMKDGICALKFQGAQCVEAGGLTNLERNAWHLAIINPDGTGLAQFAGRSNSFFVGESINHAYGGAFTPDGIFYANFFPMTNGTEAAGFGGIRRYERGANGYTPIIGITNRDESVQQFARTNPISYGVYVGNYAADPAVLPGGGLVISWAQGVTQDYGLYVINADGSGRTLLYDNPGTTELRSRLVRPRPLPPIIADTVTQVASALPPKAQGPYDIDGTFTFNALNVYFNAPVDVDILSAPPVGSANTIRFFTDFQRDQQQGSFEYLDWPILLKESPVNPDGSVSVSSPANIPLFEQLRTSQPGYTIPLTGRGASPDEMHGAAHVAGMNFGRTGEVQNCVGCHAGHSMIPVPANLEDAQWTNLAPGAAITYSSLHTSLPNGEGAVDRKVKLRIAYNNERRFWLSREGQNPNTQWLQLTFPVLVTVRTVRLYDMPASDSNVNVNNTMVRLYSDAAGKTQVASNTSGALSETGTDVPFNSVRARVVRIEFASVSGSTAGLAEVEVIARGEAEVPMVRINGKAGVAGAKLSYTGGEVISSSDGSYLIQVPPDWSGTVTPSHPCYTFTPASRSYSNLTSNQANQDYTPAINPSSNCADVSVAVGGSSMSRYIVTNYKLDSYTGVSGGPLLIDDLNNNLLVTSIRLLYRNPRTETLSELMGVPTSQLRGDYWLPVYIDDADNDSQIRFTNTSTSLSTTVNVYIGDNPVAVYTKDLGPSEADRVRLTGVVGGPVHIESTTPGANILAGMRIVYKGNSSFDEIMALPTDRLADEYWFPFYNHNNVNLFTEVRIANPSDTDTNVDIYMGDTHLGQFPVGQHDYLLQSFEGQSGGPLRVVSDNGANIIASLRLLYRNARTETLSELMGVPTPQLRGDYWLPVYIDDANNNSQIRFTNTHATESTTVNVYLGNSPSAAYSITLGPKGADRVRLPGVINGPVRIESTNPNVNILAGMRIIYKGNSSFDEIMALPTNTLDDEYWFPFYNHNNVNLFTEVRIGVPVIP